jgi:hypothetical protein
MQIELLQSKPLEVNDVSGSGGATVAEHVRHVLGSLGEAPQASVVDT